MARKEPHVDPERERRIEMEIVADAHDEDERAMGWYSYLEDNLSFPFRARCIKETETSPLAVGDEVDVIGMPDEDVCESNMFVRIRWGERPLAVPLTQLKGIDVDADTLQAMEDWQYWKDQHYEF